MKNSTIVKLFVVVVFVVLSTANQAQQKKKFDLTGLWTTDKGMVRVTQTDNSVSATFISGGECPFGAPTRTTYFTAQVGPAENGTAQLTNGTLYLCTNTKAVFDCGFGNYQTAFYATARQNMITLHAKSEYYRDDPMPTPSPGGGTGNDNGSDGSKCTHNWVRDPSGDSNRDFTLSRACEGPYDACMQEAENQYQKCVGKRNYTPLLTDCVTASGKATNACEKQRDACLMDLKAKGLE